MARYNYSTASQSQTSMTREERKVIVASSLGTVFEWYDFYLYGSLAAIIAAQIAQMLLKQAHREHTPALWAIGCLPVLAMAFCMMRSWQYLYLGRKLPTSATPAERAAKPAEKQFEKQ